MLGPNWDNQMQDLQCCDEREYDQRSRCDRGLGRSMQRLVRDRLHLPAAKASKHALKEDTR